MSIRLTALLLTCTLALGAQKSAKPQTPPAAQHKLSEFKLGKSVIGSVSLDKLKGKAVVIEAWGVNCPPCIASLPHLQELSVKYKDKVCFIGAECQMSDKKSIEAVIKKAGVTYPIVSGLTKCPINFSAIPRVFVFDGSGKLTYDGYPRRPAVPRRNRGRGQRPSGHQEVSQVRSVR
ncbi:MAG: TlpA family protein disulfide reductase [Opitutales bacterium]